MLVNRIVVDFIDKPARVARIVSGKSVASIPLSMLPLNIREGDVIDITINKKETDEARNRVKSLEDKLLNA